MCVFYVIKFSLNIVSAGRQLNMILINNIQDVYTDINGSMDHLIEVSKNCNKLPIYTFVSRRQLNDLYVYTLNYNFLD